MTNLLMATYVFADNAPAPVSTCVAGNPQSSQAYQAVQWYRDSAERNAIYREVFLWGEMSIKQEMHHAHLKPQQWGVVFDIDETVLTDSDFDKQQVLSCDSSRPDQAFNTFMMTEAAVATPGAKKITCDIQKMGGYVTLVSNRNGLYTDPVTHKTGLQATLDNLKAQGICFNQVLLGVGASGNKNARFTATQSGVYPAEGQGMAYDKTLPAHQVIAYFGDNIQDFPNTYQADMIKQDAEGRAYGSFGKMYFALPNPMYGSWQANAFQ